ncbi:MAG: tRNA epoxyqueuosine(34) reductase QueG [Bacteroidales bacterium]|nr:MAG: tRNA epoxyqueuosine(34) reductase QueG [Bacteroidales bacterium]
MADIQVLTEHIRQAALKEGFSACGIADLLPLTEADAVLDKWLQKGYHGTMSYMENNRDKRLNPSLLVEQSKSAIVVLLNYKPSRTMPKQLPQISKYAYGCDYHNVVKKMLYQLLAHINAEITLCKGVAFVDSAPVLEKALAHRAGLGWIGKNSLLVNREFGSMTYIGTLLVDIPLVANKEVVSDGCGSCRLCMDSCPTSAIVEPRLINANRCISYLNKTHKGDIADDLRPLIANRIFGCDACIDACPYNKHSPSHSTPALMPRKELFDTDLTKLTKSQFKKIVMRKKI